MYQSLSRPYNVYNVVQFRVKREAVPVTVLVALDRRVGFTPHGEEDHETWGRRLSHRPKN